MKEFSDLLPNLSDSEIDGLYQKLLLTAQEKLKKEKFSDFFTWVRAVWLTARGNPLEFDNRPYLVQVYQDQFPSIVYTKAAQMGLSERMLAESVWICDQLGKNVLYTFPTQSHLQDFVQARLEPVLNNSEYLSNRIDPRIKGEKAVEKIGLKRIGKGFLYLRGSQNEKQIITIDADAIILDERDRFDQDAVPYIDKRMLASDLKWRREVSTPTLPGIGIDEAFAQSDQRIWEIECTECGLWQELDFFKNIDFDKKKVVCRECKTAMDRLKDGRWKITHPENSTIHGYKINGIYNPQRTVEELILAYEKASVGGFSELEQFFNQVIGVPYQVEGHHLTKQDIDNCRQSYTIPAKPHSTTFAGVDVGNKVHHAVVLEKQQNGMPRIIWAGKVREFFGPIDSVESLLMNFKVKTLVIDKRPEVTKVNELIAAYPNRIYAAEYSNIRFSVQEYSKWDDIKRELLLDRTISIDYLISDVQNQRIVFPANLEAVEDFYAQLQSSIRITEKQKNTGVDVARWIEKGPDHFLHTLNYARMATQRDVTGEALLSYYREPGEMTTPSFIDWLRINGQRVN